MKPELVVVGTVQTFPEEGQDKVTVWIDLDN